MVGRPRLRGMRRRGLLAPTDRGLRKPRPHGGTIVANGPALRRGADRTMAWTRQEGRVWVFGCVAHW